MRVLGSKWRRRSKLSSLFERLENRQLFSTLTVGSGQTFTTIQSAVNAASAGDTINVLPGTYTEQVTIPSPLTGLTIQAQNPQASPSSITVPPGSSVAAVNALFPDAANSSIVAAPASMTGNKAIFDDLATNVTITGFVIEGPSQGIGFGVLVEGGATSAQINHNHILHVHDAPLSGNQTGDALEVNGASSAVISENFVSDYQNNGIFITGAATVGTVTQNVVVGQGPTSVITQNGIVFNSAASGSASSNLVTGNIYTPQSVEDGGILLFNSGQVSVTNNIVYNNDGDIILDGPSTSPTHNGSTVSGNETYGATFDGISLFDSATSVTISNNDSHNNGADGLLIDNTSTGNTVTNNTFTNNGNLDVEDDTAGQNTGDFGTGNFYSGNTASTANFPLPTGDTIFSPTSAPAAGNQNVNDPAIASAGGVDVGIKFTSDVAGNVTGVRFYKGSLETGTQMGELWSNTGTLLASVTFTGESASGWQQANFSNPVSINANTVYIIAYHTTSQVIAYTAGGLNSGIDNPPLHALANGVSGGDGVYHYDSTPGTVVFPNQYNGQAPNYWVDVVFTPTSTITATIFSPSSAPPGPDAFDPAIPPAGGVDVGIKFTSDLSGFVDSVRFYKGSQDSGVHVGELWSSTGTLLASVTFTGESASGWQQANFSSPVSITANTLYIVAYHTTSGFIAYTPGGLSSSIDNAPLHALASGTSSGNGVYHYDITPGTPVFPSVYNGQSPNYWVDVVFTTSSSSPPPTDTIFSPSAAPATPNVFDPAIPAAGGVDVGIKFTSDVPGMVDGVRFYEGSSNTGVQIGELWSNTGTLLATATFTAETGSGWQQVSFSSPVAITANTVYIIAYHTTSNTIAYTPGGLSTGIDNSPLHALANGVSGGDGVYNYDVTPGTPVFPSTYNGQAPNYWVDVVFTPS